MFNERKALVVVRKLIFIVALFAGCSNYSTIDSGSFYQILRIDEHLLVNYHLITVKSLRTEDTLYIVSPIAASLNTENDTNKIIKKNMVIETSLSQFNQKLLLNKSVSRYHDPVLVTNEKGKTIVYMDTLIVSVFISNDINGLHIPLKNIAKE